MNISVLKKMFVIIGLSFLNCSSVFANDLGVVGEVYEIQEMNFLNFIQARISEYESNGKLSELQNSMKQNAAKFRDRPHPVDGIYKTVTNKEWSFDPSIVLDRNVYSANNQLIAVAGTRINPLMHISLSKALIFIDADDKYQVQWVINQDKKMQSKTKIILVNGSTLDAEKLINKQIYFDQSGKLTNRFGIKHVPAMVLQDGISLKVKEIAI